MAGMLRNVSNAIANAFTDNPRTTLPGSLPNPQLPPQQPEVNIQTPEQLLQAANSDPVRLLEIFRAQQEAIRASQAGDLKQQAKQAELEEYEIRLENFRAQAAQAQHDAEQAQRDNLRASTRNSKKPYVLADDSPISRKSPKFPDPDQYDGDRAALKGFIYKLKAKLRSNMDWYLTEEDEVLYAVGRLKGTAEQRILPLVESDHESTIRTMDKFYEALEVAFGDPDKKATAQRYIQKLKQANRPFHQHLADFEAHIHDTGYDEQNQRFNFKEGLSSELRALLIPTRANELSFAELKKLCQRMDNEQRQITPFVPRGSRPTLNTPPALARASTAPAINRSTDDSNTAMDLSNVNQNPARFASTRGPISAQERQRRMDNKLCLYAGCSGHISKDCPLRKAAEERKALLRSVDFTPATPSEAPQAPPSGNA